VGLAAGAGAGEGEGEGEGEGTTNKLRRKHLTTRFLSTVD
jgi:hypothetical protein